MAVHGPRSDRQMRITTRVGRLMSAVAAVLILTVAAAGCAGKAPPASSSQDQVASGFDPVRASGVQPCQKLPMGDHAVDTAGLPALELPCLTTPHSVDLQRLGGKPALVNLWASWCGPCRDEMPRLQEAYRAVGDQVAFVGVDTRDSGAAAAGFLEDVGTTYPQLADPSGKLLGFAHTPGLPVTLVLGADGKIVARHIGELDDDDIEELLGAVT